MKLLLLVLLISLAGCTRHQPAKTPPGHPPAPASVEHPQAQQDGELIPITLRGFEADWKKKYCRDDGPGQICTVGNEYFESNYWPDPK